MKQHMKQHMKQQAGNANSETTPETQIDECPLLRLTAVRMAWRPTPLWVVQQRMARGPQWLQRLLPYWALSGLHRRPQDACADAFGRCLMRGDHALAQAVLALGSGFDPEAPFPEE